MKNELTKRDNYDFFDAAMNDLFPGFYGFNARNVQRYMRTDIKESDEGYTMEVEVPGVDKSDIRREKLLVQPQLLRRRYQQGRDQGEVRERHAQRLHPQGG